MKILHVVRQYHPSIGGAERFVADLAQRLIARGHVVGVVTLNKRWRDGLRLPKHEVINQVEVWRVPYVGTRLFFFAPRVLAHLQNFDVVHVHHTDFFLDFLAATKIFHRKPLVVSTHGGFFHTPQHAALKRLYFALVTRHALHAANCVIPNSLSDEKTFAPAASWAQRIDNAIDTQFFARGRGQRVRGRLITVGRLVSNKGLVPLLQVFALARAQRNDLTLHIVGEGELRVELEEVVKRLEIRDCVRWLGEVDDETLRNELAQAEIFLSGATHEAFGLALLEAMAAGCVPVVNHIEAFQDVVAHAQNGWLVDYARTAEAATTLVSALNQNLASVSQSAQQQAARYDWSAAVNQFEKIYESVKNSDS